MAIALGGWAVHRQPPFPSERRPETTRPSEAVVPVAALSLVAAGAGRDLHATVAPLALTAAALILTWVADRWPGGIGFVASAVGRTAATGVALVAFGALGLLVVVVPWLVQRLAWTDPLRAGRRGRGRWLQRSRPDPRASQPWRSDPLRERPGLWYRTRQRVVGVVVVVGIVAVAWGVGRVADSQRGRWAATPAAFEGATWWPDYHRAERWALFNPGRASNALRYPPTGDVRSRYLNVVDGERRTWRGPECDCRRVRLWLYGGSTVFGLGQRDGHTIASELARLAADAGVALDVSNRGVLGDLGWEAAQRFAWDAAAETPPDLVVFYDGYNDLAAATFFNDSGRVAERWPIDWTAESFYEDARWWPEVDLPFQRPPGAELVGPTERAPLGPVELGRTALERYADGRLAAAAVADRLGIGAHWFWQPDRFTRPPHDDEPQQPAAVERFQRTARRALDGRLPDEVVDLRGVYDDVDEAIYYDDVHTAERGAHLAALAIYERLEPAIEEVVR